MADYMVDNPGGGETVDGYSDAQGDTNVSPPDPGAEGAKKPLSPEEYAEAQKEIREQGDHNKTHPG